MPTFNEIYVNSAQIVFVEHGVSALVRQDILHSSLFAQLVANKAAPATVSDWQHQYDSGLARSQWLRVSDTTQSFAWPKQPCTLQTLLGQALADHPQHRAMLAVLDQLSHPVNAKAQSVWHAAVSKPNGESPRQGLWLQVMVVRSAVDICTRTLMLEDNKCPAGAHWLEDELRAKPADVKISMLTSNYQLRPDYAKIRPRVESALGKWAEQLTVPLLAGSDEVDTGAPELPEPAQ